MEDFTKIVGWANILVYSFAVVGILLMLVNRVQLAEGIPCNKLAEITDRRPSGQMLRSEGKVAAAEAARRSRYGVPQQLPARRAAFAGRRAELDRLDRLFGTETRAGMVVITAIAGTAGIGKTALALHWAHEIGSRFPDGQLYVDLRGFGSGRAMEPAQALHRFLDALGVTPTRIPSEAEARAALYRSLLADRCMLIVLDNAKSTAQVRLLLPNAPTCMVVVTSRDRLDGLVVHHGAERILLDPLSTEDAVELLTQRLNRARVNAEPQAIAGLIDACARLPIALSIAAAHHPDMPLRDLVERLRDERRRLDALDFGEADLSVRAVFSWSYRQLSVEAARLFRLLGVHPGPDIDECASAALLGWTSVSEARATLNELTRANLVEEHRPGRYRFHDLLRSYAAELAQGDERHHAEGRMIYYYIHASRRANLRVQPCWDEGVHDWGIADNYPIVSTYDKAMKWFAVEQATLRFIIELAGQRKSSIYAAELARGCAIFYARTGQRHERVAICRTVLAAARRDGWVSSQIAALRELARAVLRLGNFDEALDYLDEALYLNQRHGDRNDEIAIHLNYARMYDLWGKHERALRHAWLAERVARHSTNLRYRAGVLTAIAKQLACLGHSAAALPLCEEGRDLYAQVNNRDGQAQALGVLGLIYQNLNQKADAIDCYEKALDLDQRISSRYWEAIVLDQLADLYHPSDPNHARNARQNALTILHDLRHPDAEIVQTKLAMT